MLHVQLVLSQLPVPLHVHHAHLAAPLAPVHRPVQLATRALDSAQELAPSVLLISSQLVARLLVLHVQLVLSQLLVPLHVVPAQVVVLHVLVDQPVQLVTQALD